MQNKVLTADSGTSGSSAIDGAVDRSLAHRRAAVAEEVRRLVSAAMVLIQREGDLEPRVSEIVREAGLSNQAFYKHFRSKHELLVAVLDEGIRILATYLAHRMASAESPMQKIRQWIRGVLAQAVDPEGASATRPFVASRGRLSAAFPAEVSQSEQQLTAPLRDAIEAAVRTGDLTGADPERDAETLYHLMMSWVEARLMEPGPPSEADAARLEAFAMAGLAASAAGNPGAEARS